MQRKKAELPEPLGYTREKWRSSSNRKILSSLRRDPPWETRRNICRDCNSRVTPWAQRVTSDYSLRVGVRARTFERAKKPPRPIIISRCLGDEKSSLIIIRKRLLARIFRAALFLLFKPAFCHSSSTFSTPAAKQDILLSSRVHAQLSRTISRWTVKKLLQVAHSFLLELVRGYVRTRERQRGREVMVIFRPWRGEPVLILRLRGWPRVVPVVFSSRRPCLVSRITVVITFSGGWNRYRLVSSRDAWKDV